MKMASLRALSDVGLDAVERARHQRRHDLDLLIRQNVEVVAVQDHRNDRLLLVESKSLADTAVGHINLMSQGAGERELQINTYLRGPALNGT